METHKPPTNRALNVGVWSTLEHEQYLRAKYANPKASWKQIALLVGTRSARQVILHDQKFRMKMERRRAKSEPPEAPRAMTVQHDQSGEDIPEMRYIDSMGVLLLASVATTRVTKIETTATSEEEAHIQTHTASFEKPGENERGCNEHDPMANID